MKRAAQRPEPIPVYAEMGSINPVFLLPVALGSAAPEIAARLVESLVLGVGQYCTNPGLIVAQPGPSLDEFLSVMQQKLSGTPDGTMLSERICQAYNDSLSRLADHWQVEQLAGDTVNFRGTPSSSEPARAKAALFATDAAALLADRSLMNEVFGPATLLVRCGDLAEMIAVARSLEGQLTATLFASEPELDLVRDLMRVLEHRAGRLILNGVPTGVEVCSAMVHGGPYPATSEGQSSSVGTRGIVRFARPVCYQDYPDVALPRELRDDNPLGIWRLVNGRWGRH